MCLCLQLWKPGVARCLCPTDRKGERCETSLTCDDSPCVRGACLSEDENRNFTCVCLLGAEGKASNASSALTFYCIENIILY